LKFPKEEQPVRLGKFLIKAVPWVAFLSVVRFFVTISTQIRIMNGTLSPSPCGLQDAVGVITGPTPCNFWYFSVRQPLTAFDIGYMIGAYFVLYLVCCWLPLGILYGVGKALENAALRAEVKGSRVSSGGT
jgi:hypothetical protein